MIIMNADSDDCETMTLPPSYDELSMYTPEVSVPQRALRATISTPALNTMNESRRPVPPPPDLRISMPRNHTGPTSNSLLSVPGSSSRSSDFSHSRTVSESSQRWSPPMPRHFNPVTYTFTQNSASTMILATDPQESPVRYHISVQMNCFIPFSYITILRRDSEDGALVGSFEMGISRKRSTIIMDGSERLTNSVLVHRQKGKFKDLWDWKFDQNPRMHLSWHCDSPIKYCYMSDLVGKDDSTLLASLTPQPSIPRADAQPSPPVTLKIFPEGQRYADNIVFSALILERRRLTPSSEKQIKGLFT